ncbi:MAG: hypothetical protein ACKVWV_01285 [Planctomycetota bacterium]
MRLQRYPVIAAVVLVACASRKSNEAVPPRAVETATPIDKGAAPRSTQATPVDDGVIGHFETQTHRVTWSLSDAGPRFTVADLQGAVLATSLTSDEVAQRFPELADFARGAYAKLDASVLEDGILDASDGAD